MTEEIISAFIGQLIQEGKTIFKELGSEYSALLKSGINKYLSEKTSKYKTIRTILKGNTPVEFYSVYYGLNIIQKNNFSQLKSNNIISTKKTEGIFKKTNFITIIGDAGSGKSTLVKHLFMESIQSSYKIPVMIELRYIKDQKQSLLEYITSLLIDSKISDNNRIIERLLEKGKFVFFLDGFDEINAENEQNIMKEIDFFTSAYGSNNYILTTRPNSNGENITGFSNYNIAQLSVKKGDIDNFVDMQLKDEIELANKIKASVKEGASEYIKSFLTNPLLLSLYILTYQSNAEIPNKKYIFYRRVINSLYSEHDSKSKLGYTREKRSKLSQIEFEKILKYFCFISYFEAKFSFDHDYAISKLEAIKRTLPEASFDTNCLIYDLKVSVSLWLDDSGMLSFAHRSLQEYFAALFVTDISEKSKEDAYKKIAYHCEKRTNLSEIRNFVSLCEEMDEINFYKLFYIPLINEITNTLEGKNKREILKNYILYFCSGARAMNTTRSKNSTENKKVKFSPAVNMLVYKSIYIHISHTIKLHETLTNTINDISLNEKLISVDHKKTIDFNKDSEILELVIDKIIKSSEKDIADDFIKFLEKEKSDKNKIIRQSIKVDEDIMNMI